MFGRKIETLAPGETVAEFVTWLDVLAALPLALAQRVKITRTRGDEVYTCELDLGSHQQEDRATNGGSATEAAGTI